MVAEGERRQAAAAREPETVPATGKSGESRKKILK
jgi:hypothetical protein